MISIVALLLGMAGTSSPATDQAGGDTPPGKIRVVEASPGLRLPPPDDMALHFSRGRELGRAGRGEAICVVAYNGALIRCRAGSKDWFPIDYSAEAIEIAGLVTADTAVARPGSTVRFKLAYYVVGYIDYECGLSADSRLTVCRVLGHYPVSSPDMCPFEPTGASADGDALPANAVVSTSGVVRFRELGNLPVQVRICDGP